MIPRSEIKDSVEAALQRSRVVALVGPRQCGKTTIAREFVPVNSANYFDLEDPVSLARLEEPKTAMEGLHGIVVLDEVQRRPELFPIGTLSPDASQAKGGQSLSFLRGSVRTCQKRGRGRRPAL